MIETVTAFLGLFSAGIFLAHAFEAFARGPDLREADTSFKNADSESFNQFGRASRVAGVSCVTTTLYPTGSSR